VLSGSTFAHPGIFENLSELDRLAIDTVAKCAIMIAVRVRKGTETTAHRPGTEAGEKKEDHE
jgi:hypothetical protein